MTQEYEVISTSQFRYLNIFLVRMISRTSHVHRELELGLVLEGNLVLKNTSGEYALEKGALFLINSLEAHEFSSKGNGALILSIQISPRFLPMQTDICLGASARLQDHFIGKELQYNWLTMLCVELAYTYLGRLPNTEYKCLSLTSQILYQIERTVPMLDKSRVETLSSQRKTDRILSVTNYIEENFTRKLLLEEIAQREDVSLTYLSHLFKDTLGVSFQEYLKQKRFEYACNLIATTDRKILDISISSGFSDVRYLTKLFQARFQCTPREYRSRAATLNKQMSASPESTEYLFATSDGFLMLHPIRERMRSSLQSIPLDVVI